MEIKKKLLIKSTIYCDMDGVLVDFEAGINELLKNLLNGTVHVPWAQHPKILQSIENVRNELCGKPPIVTITTIPYATKKLMYDAIGSHPDEFYAMLSPLPDGVGALWSFINATDHAVHILSAPIKPRKCAVGTSADGKISWIKQHLSPQPTSINIVPAKEKCQFAKTITGIPNILIDDKFSNIDEWKQAGGIGILHVPGNSGRTIKKLIALNIYMHEASS